MVLYHIGYEGLSFNSFLTYLQYYNISTVVDVRYLPISRKKGFSKTALEQNLSMHGIQYLHLKKIGTPKPMRTRLYESWDYGEFFAAYKAYLDANLSVLDSILNLISTDNPVLLLCYEKDPETCHRKIIAKEVQRREGNGLKVKPIFRTH